MFGGYGLQILVQADLFHSCRPDIGCAPIWRVCRRNCHGIDCSAISPSFGAANLLVKNVARDRSLLADYWGNGLLMICVSGSDSWPIILGSTKVLLPDSVAITSVLLVGVSDLDPGQSGRPGRSRISGHRTHEKVRPVAGAHQLFRLAGIILLKLFVASHGQSLGICLSCCHCTTATIALVTTS